MSYINFDGIIDTGYFYCPYVPIYMTPKIYNEEPDVNQEHIEKLGRNRIDVLDKGFE